MVNRKEYMKEYRKDHREDTREYYMKYRKEHIDHIVPKSHFRYEKPEDLQFKECWALHNLQPMWAKENLVKGNRNYQMPLLFKETI